MSAPPAEFLCPISYEVMSEPVVLGDGHTYDGPAIRKWFETHTTSPMTNQEIDPATMAPNYALRTAIERWKAEQAAAGAAVAPAIPLDRTMPFQARVGGSFAFVECLNSAQPLNSVVVGVLDRSGSMSEPSARPGGSAAAEASLFSRMDVVAQSVRTMVPILGSRDTPAAFGIVSFSDTARVDLPIQPMDGPGQAEAEKAIRRITPGGCTNIWDGLRVALDQVSVYAAGKADLNVQIVLLTDGEPTASSNPPEGIVEALKGKLAALAAGGVLVTVNSFGFGYNLDAELLRGISMAGSGIYGYIPDCSMAGSVFINFVAATLSVVANHVMVNGIPVGTIQSGKARTVELPAGTATTALDIRYGFRGKGQAKIAPGTATDDEIFNAMALVRLRKELKGLLDSWRYSDISTAGLRAMLDWIGDEDGGFRSAVKQDIHSSSDARGQLTKAVSREDWFNSWGKNHLISYARALANEQCVNFKDAALQFFAGPLFKEIQTRGNTIFNNLPAPKPSLSNSSGYSYFGGGPAIPATMAMFNDAGGGCFAGHCQVQMADNTMKFVSQIRRGDVVQGGFRVLCVVRTTLMSPPKMVRLPGLDITPWHPVRTEAAWKFPIELAEAQELTIHAYYNFVLESGHYVRIGAYDVCTLGHGFTQNHVIRHPYFGTNRVIDDLRAKAGWGEGLVDLTPDCRQRDPETGLVSRV
jgi:hypothetical protein